MNPDYKPGKNGVRIGRYAAFGLAALTIITFGLAMMAIHYITPADKRIFSTISIAFAFMSSLILLADYYVQFSVVPISFMKGEIEGIPLISQYNGHGIFIALEELGYWLMALSFLFIAPAFSRSKSLERSIRWALILPFPLIVISFIVYTILYGIDRDYRFEVAAITVDWLALILVGILAGIFFSRLSKQPPQGSI